MTARRLLKAKNREYISRLATDLEAESHRSNSQGFFEQLKEMRNGYQSCWLIRTKCREAKEQIMTDKCQKIEEGCRVGM